MNNNKMISKELCDFLESTKGNPNNLISFLRKAGHLANFSLNEVLFMKKENMRESPYKDMSKAEKAELLKKIFKNNESLEVNLSNLSEDRANEFANDALINKGLFKKLIDVCVYERLDENAQLFKNGNYFISRKEIDDFSKLPLNIKLTAIGYAKKAAYLTLSNLYKAKEMQKEPAQNKKIEELSLSYEQMATSAMANSQLKELREVKGQIELLEIAKKNFNEQKYKMQEDEKKLTAEIAEKEKAMNYFKEDLVCIEQNPKKELIVYDNVKYNDINDAHKALLKHMESKEQYVHGGDRKISLGNYRGFDFKIAKDEISGRYKFFLKNKLTYSSNFAKSKNIFSQLDDFIDNEIKNLETRTSEELLYAKRKYQDILEHKDDKFPDEDELIKLKLRKEKLDEAKEEILKELELRDKILEEKFIKNGMLTERGDFMDFNKKIEFSM